MKISTEKLKKLCSRNKVRLNRLLVDAGVSRNAYYSLTRKDTVLPRSIMAIADQLNVPPSAFLEEENPVIRETRLMLAEMESITARHGSTDQENVRHTLLLLNEKPIERLRRALIRGRKPDIR